MRKYIIFSILCILIGVQAIHLFDTTMINVLIALIEISLAYYLIRMTSDYCKSAISEKDCSRIITRVVRKTWHDLLNCVQVISCYATLGKNNEIIEYIQHINHLAKQNKLISSFLDDGLVVYIYKLPIDYPALYVEIEIDDTITELEERIDGKHVLKTLKKFVDTINESVDQSMETNFSLFISGDEENLVISIEVEGNIKHISDQLNSLGNKLIKRNGGFDINQYTEEVCSLVLYIPLKKSEE